MTDLYGADLAALQHEHHGGLAAAAAPVEVAELRRAGFHEGLVVDLGCGSGVLARALKDAGYDVLGVDPSRDLLALAMRTAPGAHFMRGSAHDVDLPPCVAVTAIGEVLGYGVKDRLRSTVRRVHRALVPGGAFVFDLAGPGRAGRTGQCQTVQDHGDWLVAVQTAESADHARLTRDITLFRRVGDRWRRSDETHQLRLHRPRDVLALLRDAGFEARQTKGYGPVHFEPGWAGFVARRAAKVGGRPAS